MSLVLFLRAVNVGGHQVFRPSLLARELAHLGVINLGAAGTFVVPGSVSQKTLRTEVVRRLPVPAELMICPGREVVDLVAQDPFPVARPDHDVRRFVSVMAKRPPRTPSLPLTQPAGMRWQVKIVGVSGRFALSIYRRVGPSSVDLNGLVEKHFDVSATTRSWTTMSKIKDMLERGRTAS
ncbi:MAG TPA: hypothetical protein VJL31_06460 [Gemmatimonadales bacterium]|jgi:uncharacterized protein (DUF1697 family)|nr:hypothetical protein [Gemmatimonadales bacterium]